MILERLLINKTEYELNSKLIELWNSMLELQAEVVVLSKHINCPFRIIIFFNFMLYISTIDVIF